MKVVHHFLNRSISKETEVIGLMTTDNVGGYFLLNSKDQTRYQGWSVRINDLMYKIIDAVTPEIDQRCISLENRIWKIRRRFETFYDDFILPYGFSGFFYRISSNKIPIKIYFDIKKGYENPTEGRMYQIKIKNDKIFHIHFEQQLHTDNFSLDVIAKIDKGEIIKNEVWELKKYEYDKNRNSPPFEKWVFNALTIKGAKEIIFSVGLTYDEALKKLNRIYKNKKTIIARSKKLYERYIQYTKNIPSDLSWASALCKSSLRNLIVLNDAKDAIEGIYAGLPWFFQYWLHDEAFALKALAYLDKDITQGFIIKRLKEFLELQKIDSCILHSVDGMLLYLVNAARILKSDPSFFTSSQKLIMQKTFNHLNVLLTKMKNENGLLSVGSRSSWMDSIERSDYPLEIQCLFAAFLIEAYFMTKDNNYLKQLKISTQTILREYFKNDLLNDGLNDPTVRPNIFLAYYFLPRLLRRKDWEKVFDMALNKLYMPWGGLSTIDKDDSRFSPFYTGEDPISYHQGDSWFFINNIAAMALLEVNAQKFSYAIKSIVQASTEDILWRHVPGHASELSSASTFSPAGSPMQLWSCASLYELLKKLYPFLK